VNAKVKPFRGPRQKLARAGELISEWEKSIAEYLAGKWCTVTFTEDDDGIFHTKMGIHGAPRNYETILGDALHNMRSALDLMAVEAVRINGGNEAGVKFPFCETEAELEQAIKSANFHRASEAAQTMVRAFRPYKGGDDLLRALHDLDIENKHPPDCAEYDESDNPQSRCENRERQNAGVFGPQHAAVRGLFVSEGWAAIRKASRAGASRYAKARDIYC
jgi:hypothetical protein